MQGGLVRKKLSVCPSMKHVDCDEMEESSVQIIMPDERTFSLVLWEKEWLVGDNPFYLKFWVKLTLLKQKCRFSVDICS